MSRRKPTVSELKEREQRAQKLRAFMKDNLFSEEKLANHTGISRRTIQMIKAGKVTPHIETLRKLTAIFARFEVAKNRLKEISA